MDPIFGQFQQQFPAVGVVDNNAIIMQQLYQQGGRLSTRGEGAGDNILHSTINPSPFVFPTTTNLAAAYPSYPPFPATATTAATTGESATTAPYFGVGNGNNAFSLLHQQQQQHQLGGFGYPSPFAFTTTTAASRGGGAGGVSYPPPITTTRRSTTTTQIVAPFGGQGGANTTGFIQQLQPYPEEQEERNNGQALFFSSEQDEEGLGHSSSNCPQQQGQHDDAKCNNHNDKNVDDGKHDFDDSTITAKTNTKTNTTTTSKGKGKRKRKQQLSPSTGENDDADDADTTTIIDSTNHNNDNETTTTTTTMTKKNKTKKKRNRKKTKKGKEQEGGEGHDCQFCTNDREWTNKIYYKCGTVISKYFPKSKSNPIPGWYKGTIREHHLSYHDSDDDDDEEEEAKLQQKKQQHLIICNEIHYEDGDIESIPQDDLRRQLNADDDPIQVKIVSQSATTTTTTTTTTGTSNTKNSEEECHNNLDESLSETKSNNEKWQEKFEKLKQFKAETGHCRVPRYYDDDKEDQSSKLGGWVHMQRERYKAGRMAQDRIDKLNQLGFDWAVVTKTHKEAWEDKLDRIQKFKARNGHCCVPANYKSDPSLSKWVSNQRVKYHRGSLPLDRTDKLNEIGFEWVGTVKQVRDHLSILSSSNSPRDRNWLEKYQQLKRLKMENGHCRVPFQKHPGPVRTLGRWVVTQRLYYKKGSLDLDRKELLEIIGFDWKGSCSESSLSQGEKNKCDGRQGKKTILQSTKKTTTTTATVPIDSEDHHNQTKLSNEPLHLSNNRNQKWQAKYSELKRFKAMNGHCCVPQTYLSDPSLAKWVCNQRQMYKNGKLAADRLNKLIQIGFLPGKSTSKSTSSSPTWDDMYERLQKYKAENGDCRVPTNYEPDPSLGFWVSSQRRKHKLNKIDAYQTNKLNKIDFDWVVHPTRKPHNIAFDDMYDRLKQFKNDNGHCRVPFRYSLDPPLGTWVSAQRKKYLQIKKPMTVVDNNRVRKLNEIGFIWIATRASDKNK